MWWVVVAVLVFVAGYTFITIKYRKTTKPAEPYQDAKDRTVAARLQAAGYRRVDVAVERPAEPGKARAAIEGPAAEVKEAIGGLTPELKETLIDQPTLPDRFSDVKAKARTTAMMPYPIVFTCNLPDNKGVLGETKVYVKELSVVIVTNFDRLSGGLLARTQESAVQVTLPAGTFESGKTYDVTLIGKNGSKRWTVQVN